VGAMQRRARIHDGQLRSILGFTGFARGPWIMHARV
jgi:hypothetical protein